MVVAVGINYRYFNILLIIQKSFANYINQQVYTSMIDAMKLIRKVRNYILPDYYEFVNEKNFIYNLQ